MYYVVFIPENTTVKNFKDKTKETLLDLNDQYGNEIEDIHLNKSVSNGNDSFGNYSE